MFDQPDNMTPAEKMGFDPAGLHVGVKNVFHMDPHDADPTLWMKQLKKMEDLVKREMKKAIVESFEPLTHEAICHVANFVAIPIGTPIMVRDYHARNVYASIGDDMSIFYRALAFFVCVGKTCAVETIDAMDFQTKIDDIKTKIVDNSRQERVVTRGLPHLSGPRKGERDEYCRKDMLANVLQSKLMTMEILKQRMKVQKEKLQRADDATQAMLDALVNDDRDGLLRILS